MRRPAIQRSHGLVCSRVTHGQTVRRERMTGVNKGTYGAGGWAKGTEVVIGLDLSDRVSTWEAVDRHGVRASGKVEMTREAVREAFAGMERALVVMEAGTHTLWVAKVLREIGHDVHTVDARELVRARGMRKTDKRDAERLMSLGWDIVHGKPVARVRERTIEQQGELALVRGRDALVRARGRLISTVCPGSRRTSGLITTWPFTRMPPCLAHFRIFVPEALTLSRRKSKRTHFSLTENFTGASPPLTPQSSHICPSLAKIHHS